MNFIRATSRAMLFLVLFGVCSTSAQSNEKKSKLPWNYREAKETSGATSYVFDEKSKPKLMLGSKGELTDLKSINVILKKLGLPEVKKLVPDRESITGLRAHRGTYYWPDYPVGELTIKRTLTRDSYGSKEYDAIFKITIAKKD